MTYRTDVEYRDGKLAVRQDTSADARKALPAVELPDQLASTNWAVSFKKELAQYGYDEDASLLSVLATQRGMAESAQRLTKMRDNQHPRDTQYQHLNRVAKEFDQSVQRHQNAYERARSTIQGRLDTIESDFRKSVGYNTKDAQEIRAVLRSMEPAERSEAISEAIASGDGNVLGAILDANPIATGISKDQQQNYRAHAMKVHRADLLALERELKRADDLMVKSYTGFLELDDTVTAKRVREQYEALARKAEAQESQQPQWS